MLNDDDRALLDMEKRTFRLEGPKASAIRAELGLSMTAYQQRLLALIEREEALVAEPVLVNRLRRLRETRRLAHRPIAFSSAATDTATWSSRTHP